jgi:hypothetical protein
LGVAIGLVFFPTDFFPKVGYHIVTEPFFKVQGGVFHLVMAVAYLLAASGPIQQKKMVLFSFTAKFIATVFLVVYYLAVDPILVILLSGAGDFTMGLILFFLYIRVIPSQHEGVK